MLKNTKVKKQLKPFDKKVEEKIDKSGLMRIGTNGKIEILSNVSHEQKIKKGIINKSP